MTVLRFALGILLTIVFGSLTAGTNVRSQRQDESTSILETGYHVVPSYGGKYKIISAVVAANPYDNKFASRPAVRVTARAADGSIITTREISSAGIPPKARIAFCESLYADEMPSKVEFRALDAGYQPTVYKPADFLPFELLGVRVRDDGMRQFRITGEIKNPYPGKTGVWITFLYRDAARKLIGGHTKWESTILAGDPTPFEMHVAADEVPPGMKTIENFVFSHNNYQSSWNELLRR